MKTPLRLTAPAALRRALLPALVLGAAARAEPPPDPDRAWSHPPTPAEIAADLGRIRSYLDAAMPARLAADGAPDAGEAGAFKPLAYEAGLVHSGMLRAAEATGDGRFAEFTARHLRFIAGALPRFREEAAKSGADKNPFRPILEPRALDDCGAMEAALIRARRAGIGPDFSGLIGSWGDYIGRRQFRLEDGTLARHRPQPVSVWADDLYMGVPALAEMGRHTGDPAWFDLAARDALGTAGRLFRPGPGLYAHGWHADATEPPDIFWSRANGWAVLAFCDLLDALPEGHPAREPALRLLRAHLRGVASRQSGGGLWHQLLDREDSYLETSGSAMFVYGLAHAINRGWIAAPTYGSVAQAGWNAVAAQVNARGQVESTCVGTTLAGDFPYYYRRPVSPYAMHGYGAVLLAGAEMIALLKNPALDIQRKNEAWHYIPKSEQAKP